MEPTELAGRYMEFVRHYFNDISNQTACIKNGIIYDSEIDIFSMQELFKKALSGYAPDKLYYFNANHLGSGSLITDKYGQTYQTLIYAPHGEVLLNKFYGDYDEVYKFTGYEKDNESGLNYAKARYQDPSIGFNSTDAKWYLSPHQSSYTYAGNNPIMFVDKDGQAIVLPAGTSTKNIYTILGNLQKLTNDKLVYSTQKDGTIKIKIASLGEGKKTTGTNLIRSLNSSKQTVTIKIGDADSKNFEQDSNSKNASNGVGTDATINFNPLFNPSVLTTDPKTGNVSGATRPNEIGLGHELIHADRSMNGEAVDYSITDTHTYKDATGSPITQTKFKEELETVGLKGNYKYTENKLRREQGLNERGAY